MEVRAVMTREPITVTPADGLNRAMKLMKQHGIRHLPVVADGRLVGVLSDRDLLGATGWLPLDERISCTIVADAMATDPIAVSPEDSVVTAAVELSCQGLGCLPVVGEDRLVGILTDMDLLRALSVRERDSHDRVSEIMSVGPQTASRALTVGAAAKLLDASGARHLPVLEGGGLVGIVSDRDLQRARGARLPETTPLGDILSHPVSIVSDEAPIALAARTMVERKISALPVIHGRELVGIVTSVDVIDYCVDSLREADPA